MTLPRISLSLVQILRNAPGNNSFANGRRLPTKAYSLHFYAFLHIHIYLNERRTPSCHVRQSIRSSFYLHLSFLQQLKQIKNGSVKNGGLEIFTFSKISPPRLLTNTTNFIVYLFLTSSILTTFSNFLFTSLGRKKNYDPPHKSKSCMLP